MDVRRATAESAAPDGGEAGGEPMDVKEEQPARIPMVVRPAGSSMDVKEEQS